MSEIRIKAESRTEFGKGAARRVRRESKVPAVLYGHGTDPQHLSLPGHELMLALKHPNALLSIDVDGARPQLALAKQVQRDPVKGFIEHADLLAVRQGEKVTVDIPVIVVGTAASDTLVVTETAQLSVLSEATHLPDSVEVSVEGVAAGTQIHAGDLQLAEGTTLAGDADMLIVNVVAAQSAEAAEAELAEAEADAGIERDESTAEADATDGDDSSEESPASSEE